MVTRKPFIKRPLVFWQDTLEKDWLTNLDIIRILGEKTGRMVIEIRKKKGWNGCLAAVVYLEKYTRCINYPKKGTSLCGSHTMTRSTW